MREQRNNEKKILFICEGNVGRSQMAEGFYNFFSMKNIAISAGINDVGMKYNYVPREDIIKAMQEKGIDISNQRIKQLSPNHLLGVTTVVALCKKELLPQFVFNSNIEVLFREVEDPFEAKYSGVISIRNAIEIIVLELLNNQQK